MTVVTRTGPGPDFTRRGGPTRPCARCRGRDDWAHELDTTDPSYEEACAAAPLGGARALQHRRGRLRPASAREARDDPRALRGRRCARCSWGELQDLANQVRERARGARRASAATASRCCCRRRRRPRRCSSATWKLGAILLSMSVLYGDEGIRHRVARLAGRRCSSPTRPTPTAFERALVEHVLVLDDELLAGGSTDVRDASTPRPTTRRSSTTPRARPGWRRASCTPTATCSPTRSSIYCHDVQRRRALPRHGRVGVGGRDLPAARPVAPRRGAVRLPARGRLRPRTSSSPSSRATRSRNVFATPTAIRSMMSIADAAHALPAALPDRLLGRRAAEPRGDPLVSRAVRRHRARLLRADRVLPAVRQLPVHGGARGVDGPADARLGGRDPRRGRAAGARRASAARSACARAPTRTTRSATGTGREDAARRPSAASGSTPRTPRGWTRTATSGTRAAPTT